MKGVFYEGGTGVVKKGTNLLQYNFEKNSYTVEDAKRLYPGRFKTMRVFYENEGFGPNVKIIDAVCHAGFVNTASKKLFPNSRDARGAKLVANTTVKTVNGNEWIVATRALIHGEEIITDFELDDSKE